MRIELSKQDAGFIRKILDMQRDINRELMLDADKNDGIEWQKEIDVMSAVISAIEEQMTSNPSTRAPPKPSPSPKKDGLKCHL